MLSVCLWVRWMMPTTTAAAGWTLNLIAPAVAFGMLVSGYIARNEAYKAHWQGDAVTPQGYLQANIVLGSLLCLASGTIGAMLVITGGVMWHLALALVVLVLSCLSFPTGRPMRPRAPRIENSE